MKKTPKNPEEALAQREAYIREFNFTLVKIWKERIILTQAIRTGFLYRSVIWTGMKALDKFTSATFKQQFVYYGVFVDYGTGSNTPIGNPGDIGRNNLRKRKIWFSRKYYASVMNIREFLADNLGVESVQTISNAICRDYLRHDMRVV